MQSENIDIRGEREDKHTERIMFQVWSELWLLDDFQLHNINRRISAEPRPKVKVEIESLVSDQIKF